MTKARDMENGVVLIASASATASLGPNAILVWQWGSNKKAGDQEVVDGGWTTGKGIGFLIKLVVVIAAMAYLVELIGKTVCSQNPSTGFVANIHQDRKLGYGQRTPGERQNSAHGSSSKKAMGIGRVGQVTELQ